MMPSQELWERCALVIRNGGPQEAIDRIMTEAEGYRHVLRLSRTDAVLQKRTIDGLREFRGWLGVHMETTAAPAHKTIVNTSATASANVSININQAMSQMWSLPDTTLRMVDKQELAELLAELEDSRGSGSAKVKKAAKAVGDWLFDKGIEAIPAVMPFVTEVVRSAIGS